MPKKTPGLDGRDRDFGGEIRHKRADTLVGNLRKEYGSSFAKGYRSDAKLSSVLKSTGSASLSEYLKHSKRAKRLSSRISSSDVSNTIFVRTTVLFKPALKSLAKK